MSSPGCYNRIVELLSRFQDFLNNHPDINVGQGIVAGVSGGPDSLAMLDLLRRVPEIQVSRVMIAHLDHALRSESSKDAKFVQHTARKWGFPVVVERKDVAKLAATNKLSVEDAGRQARYTFLARVAIDHRANSIFVAHNADDQAETVLMHVLRGAGLAGLIGMSPVTSMRELQSSGGDVGRLLLVRPLLGVTRADIESYCQSRGLYPCEDATNTDLTLLRNRLRHEILPILASVNPKISTGLRRMASLAAADHQVLCAARELAWDEVLVDLCEDRVVFDRACFDNMLCGLRRSLIRAAVAQLRPEQRSVDYEPIALAADFSLKAAVGQSIPLPGSLALEIDYDHLTIGPAGVVRPMPLEIPCLPSGEMAMLDVPGKVRLNGAPWSAEADDLGQVSLGIAFDNDDQWSAYLDADRLPGPLVLRTRRSGDIFQPLGLQGHSQSLVDFMAKAKIPKAWRDRLPILVSGEQIVWIPGWRLDHRTRLTEATQRVWRVRLLPGA